jgi:hypothetical protein
MGPSSGSSEKRIASGGAFGNALRTAAGVEVRGSIAGIGGIDLYGRVPEQICELHRAGIIWPVRLGYLFFVQAA